MSENKPYLLCVDDDLLNLELMVDFLEEDHELKCVENGQECLDAVAERKPDLILLDLMMPVMDGRECCKILKQTPGVTNIPIIILSAQSYEEDMREMFEMGVDSYITKPFSEKRLRKVIGDYLSA